MDLVRGDGADLVLGIFDLSAGEYPVGDVWQVIGNGELELRTYRYGSRVNGDVKAVRVVMISLKEILICRKRRLRAVCIIMAFVLYPYCTLSNFSRAEHSVYLVLGDIYNPLDECYYS